MVEVVFAPDGTATYNRYAFYQWDAGQKLKIIGLSLEPTVEIHFANKGLPAVVMLGETENGVTIVDVPDVVLQRYGELNVYIYRNDGTLNYTSNALLFTVRKRERPVDYVEQVQPGIIAQLVNKLNKIIETGIASYEPDANVVNQMIKDYVSTNMIANNQATTEAGYALDARQANPSIEGTLGAQIMSLGDLLNSLNNNLAFQTTIDLADCNTFAEVFDLMRANPYRVGLGRVGNLDSSTNFKTLVGNPTGFANYTVVYVRLISNNIMQFTAIGTLIVKFAIDYVIYDNGTYSRVGWNVLK